MESELVALFDATRCPCVNSDRPTVKDSNTQTHLTDTQTPTLIIIPTGIKFNRLNHRERKKKKHKILLYHMAWI